MPIDQTIELDSHRLRQQQYNECLGHRVPHDSLSKSTGIYSKSPWSSHFLVQRYNSTNAGKSVKQEILYGVSARLTPKRDIGFCTHAVCMHKAGDRTVELDSPGTFEQLRNQRGVERTQARACHGGNIV